MKLLIQILILLLSRLVKYMILQIDRSVNIFTTIYFLVGLNKSPHQLKRYWVGNWLRNDHTA